jgi:hypothetical protein
VGSLFTEKGMSLKHFSLTLELGNLCIAVLEHSQPLFHYLKNSMTYGNSVCGIKWMFHFSLKRLFKPYFISANILCMRRYVCNSRCKVSVIAD